MVGFTYRLGCGNDHGLCDHDHSRDPGDRPFEGSSPHGDVEKDYDRLYEESDDYRAHVHDHGQSRSARMLMEEFGPTVVVRLRIAASGIVTLTSIFRRSSLPMRLLCISW